ncbi:hypothetical protein LELG_01823 [Lodderomyces elongisporus NRRL YB-4239]|uniref:DH domain-containing protein n=1 Tax=Lodderomyces elongisporus (strain ATCC 11503 / CBS 2605 / JCM 1781 / NBRC 1676 / NRRL YB-4239) TaxID=379508 RepID=A5DWT6_LODEL|nr:hypothetical protein LELG_01823 [Lodderomyces elongisporus NRRL YB-4239]
MSNSTRKMLRRKPPPLDIDLNLNVNSTITSSAIVLPHSPSRLSSPSPLPQQQQQQQQQPPPPPPLPELLPPKPTKPLPPPSSSPPPPPTATATAATTTTTKTKTATDMGCLDSSYNISNDFIASANTKIPARPKLQMIHMTRASYSEQPVQTLQQQQQQQQQQPQMDYMGLIALESNYINSSFDESFSLADSPKPRGPRDISDYENNIYIDDDNEDDNNHNKNSTFLEASPSMNSMQTPSTSILPRSRYQLRRSFQQISRPGAVSSPSQSGISNVDTNSYSTQRQQRQQQQQQPQQQKLPHEIHTPERNLPYPTKPIEDLLAEDIEQGYSFYVDSPSQQRTRAIIDHSVKNTSPQLTDVPNLSNRSSQSTIYVQNRRPSLQYDLESPMSSSPLSNYTPRHKHSTYSFSNEPDIAILPNGQSRSPSPDKLFQRKHNSIISNYQQAEGYFDGHYERNDYNYYSDYNEYTNNDDSGMTNEYTAAPSPNLPRSPQLQYRVVSDNPFYIDENDGNNNMDNYTNADYESPVTDYFDYSILPELPSKVPTSVERKDFPLPSLPDKPLLTVPRTKEKQELPPLPLDLPQLPFNSASLQEAHFASCPQVWSLSQIFKWCCKLQIWLAELTISRSDLTKAIVRLLAFHRSDVPLNIITRSSQTAFNAFLQAKAIEVMELHTATDKGDRSIVAFNEHIYVNGVFPELTGCYSPTPHSKDEESLCYASYCNFSKMKNLERKMRNMNIKDIVLANDWASHWRLTIDDLKGIDPTLIKRQSLIFDLLRYEQTFIQRAQCFVEVVCPAFIKTAQTYTSNSKVKKFQSEVLPAARNILEIHQRKLFEPLLKILIAEGKFIMSIIEIVNIYIDWAKEVRSHLMTYTNNMPMIEDLLSIAELKAFVDTKIGVLPRVRELKVNIAILFISTFNSRYQQIPLQLLDIRNKYQENEPEHFLLKQASDEIKGLGSKINDSKRTADNVHAMEQIKAQLLWKSSVKQINLNLNSSNRKFICRGDLTRKSDLKLTTQINHLVILDNYLLITERVKNPKISGILYKICEDPIPIDFLMFSQKVAGSTVYPIKLASTSSFRTPIQQQLQQQQQQQQQHHSCINCINCINRNNNNNNNNCCNRKLMLNLMKTIQFSMQFVCNMLGSPNIHLHFHVKPNVKRMTG